MPGIEHDARYIWPKNAHPRRRTQRSTRGDISVITRVIMPPILGQSLLVIGGSSGIGTAVAILATEQGVRVSIASSNPTRVANAVAKIQSLVTVPDTHIRGLIIDLSLPAAE